MNPNAPRAADPAAIAAVRVAAAGLRTVTAVNASNLPGDLRADYVTVVAPLGPLADLMERTADLFASPPTGDSRAALPSSELAKVSAPMLDPSYKAASLNMTVYVNDHCTE